MEETQDPPLTPQQFSAKIKAKYPEYKDVDDIVLAKKIIEKYPEYEKKVSFGEVKKKGSSKPTSQEAAGVSPTRTTTPGTSSDTEPPMGAQASGGLGGPFQSIDPFGGKSPVQAIVSEQQKTATLPTKKAAPAITKKVEPPKEEDGFVDYLIKSVDSGIATVSKSIYDAPALIYDAAASLTNPIARAFGGEEASSEKFAETFGLRNIPSEMLKEKIDRTNKSIQEYNDKNGGDALTAIQNGNYTGAAKMVAGTTMQSLPLMVAAMATGGESLAMTGIGVSAASTKASQLKEENPEMDVSTRTTNAAFSGILEATLGHLLNGASGAVVKKIITDKGVEAGSKIVSNSIKNILEKNIEKNPVIGLFGEVVEESLVEFGDQANDMLAGKRDSFNYKDIANAGISATGMGSTNTVAVYGAKGFVSSKDYIKAKNINKEISKLTNELTNENLSDTDKGLISNKINRLVVENQKIIGDGLEKVNVLPEDIKKNLLEVNSKLDDVKSQAFDIKDNNNISDETKKTLLDELKLQFKTLEDERVNILSGKTTAEGMSVKAPEKNVFYYYEAKGEKAPTEVPVGYTSMKRVENSEEVKLWNAQKPSEIKTDEVTPTETKAEEVKPDEVKEPAIVVHATVDQKGFALSHSEGIAKENILEPSDTRDFTRTATPEQKTEYNKGMAVVQTDEALDNGDKKISIVKSMVDPAGREGGATFDFVIPQGNNTTSENIKQVIDDVASNRDLKGKKLIDETVKQVKNYIDSNKPTEVKAEEVAPVEALKDVESTAKALEGNLENMPLSFDYDAKNPSEVSEAYHKAKAEGTNPELVKAVEDLTAKPAEEIKPDEVKEPAIVVHGAVNGFDLQYSEGIDKKDIVTPQDGGGNLSSDQQKSLDKYQSIITKDEVLDNKNKSVTIITPSADNFGRSATNTFDFIIPEGNTSTTEGIKSILDNVTKTDLKGKEVINESVKQVKEYIDSNKPTEVKAEEVKPAIESPIELKEGEELVDVKQDEKGNTYTYVSETSEKKGVKTTKFKFNRSDKSSEQRNTTGVDADKVLDKYGYEIPADEIIEGVEIIKINEIREGEKTTGATVTFKDAETGNTFRGEILLEPKAKEAKPAEVKTKEVTPVKDQKSTYLEEQKFFQETSPFAWAVDEVSPETLDKSTIVENEGTYGVVTPDGDIKGVFNPNVAKVREGREAKKGTIRTLIENAIAAGGIKLDNFDGRLTKIYSDNGFREVSRVSFNEEYAPEGWNKEEHGTPDVVAMVYDPEGKLDIEKKSFTDYDEAMKYRDSYVEQAKKLQEAPAEVKSISQKIGEGLLTALGISPESDVKFSKIPGEPDIITSQEEKERQIVEKMNEMELINNGIDFGTSSTTKEKIDVKELNSRLETPLKEINWSDYEGIPFGFTISDQLRTGDEKNPYTGETITDLKGGIGFNGTKGNENKGWANTTKAEGNSTHEKAVDIYNNNKSLFEKLWKEGKIPNGVIPFGVVKMGENSIVSNEALSRVAVQNIETLPKSNRKKAVSALVKSMKDKIASESNSLKRGVDQKGKPYTENTIKLKKKSIKQYEKILDIINKYKYNDIANILKDNNHFSLPERSLIMNQILYGKPNEIGAKSVTPGNPTSLVSKTLLEGLDKSKRVLINLGNITDLLTEPSMKNVPNMHIVSIVGVKVAEEVDGKWKPAGGVVETNHPNYKYGVEGNSIGVLNQPIHMKDAFGEAYGSALGQVVKNEANKTSITEKGALTQGIPVQSGLPNRVFKSAIAKGNLDAVDKLSGFLRQAFPSVTFFTSQDAWNAAMAEPSIKKKLKDGEVVYAFTTDGNVFINPNLKTTKATLHETGHIWMSFVKENNPDIHNKGLSLVDGTKEHQKSKEQYGDTDLAREEALMELMSSKGDTIVNAAQKAKFKEWLLSLYKYISENFNSLIGLSPAQIENLTLDKFLEGMLADILSGKELTSKKTKGEVKFSLESQDSKIKDYIESQRKSGVSDVDIKEGIESVADKLGLTPEKINQLMGLKDSVIESKGLDVISKGVANMDDFFNEMSKDEDFNSLTEEEKKDLYYNSVSKYSTSQAVDQAAQAPKLIDLKDQNWLKKFIQAFQNKMIRVKDVQEQMEGALGIKILKEANVALKFELLVGKTINIIEDKQKEIFDKSNKDSWANRAKKDGVDIDQLGTYMYALHAEERNLANATEREENFKKEVDALNEKIKNAETQSLKTRYENELKKLISGQGKVKLLKEAGSGMTNEQAQEIIDNVEKSGKKELFDKYAKEFREKVIKPALDDKLKYGLIDQDLYDKLQTQYKNYVPLQVVEKAMTKRVGGAGAGASVKGKDIFKAKGSDLYKYTDRYNPIFSSLFEYNNTIGRGERNQASQALINLAELDEKNEVFKIHKPKYIAILDDNGDVSYLFPTTPKKVIDDSVELKVDGKPVFVEIKDKAMRDALQNQGIQRGIRGLYIVNSWIRSTATLMNPNFLITNFLRDYQSALINIQSEIKDLDIKNITSKIANPKNLKSAGQGIIQDSKGNYDSEWAKLAKEYRDSGGKVSWFQKETLEEYVDSLRKDIEKINKGEKMYTAALNKLGNTLMLAQSVVEQSVRLSTFKALKDAGVSTEEAARAAKNITVNFENKGTWGGLMDSLYLFATAGLSGTVRMATSLAKSKTARTIAGGMFAYGILEAALNSHLGGDDDDDEKIDDGIKERNFVLVNPKDSKQEPLLLPMAYGLNVFKYAGNLTYDVATGRKDATEATSKMFMTIYNQISPLQGPTLSQAVAPTAFDPFVQQSENKNFFGAPIKPEQPKFGAKKKESDLYFESVRPGSLWTAKKLNEWTGGSAMEKGYVDISPEILDHYYDALGGGTGKFISDVGYTGKIAAKEVVESIHGKEMKDKDEFSLRRLPFVKAFFGSKPEKKELQYIYETFERSAIDQLSKEEVTKFKKQLKEAVKSQALERQDAKQMYNTVMEGQYKIKKYKGVQEVRPADMTKKQYIKFIKGAN